MKYKVTLKGRTYEVEVEKGEAMVTAEYEAFAPAAAPVPAAASQPAPAAVPAASAAVNVSDGDAVTSPLPGTVLDIKVAQGASVKSGQILLFIEALKMENEILAPRDGVVKQIVVTKGSQVNTGDALVVLA